MENKDRAQEREHGDVLGEAADEDVSGAELLVGLQGLIVYGEDGEGVVEVFGHCERTEDDEEG